MTAYSLLLLAAILAAPAGNLPVAGPKLDIAILPNNVQFTVAGPQEEFLGVVLGSLQPDLAYYFVGLPPLLADHVVLAFGLGTPDDGYVVKLQDTLFPAGISIYAQGVTLDGGGLQSTNIADFVLDVTVP